MISLKSFLNCDLRRRLPALLAAGAAFFCVSVSFAQEPVTAVEGQSETVSVEAAVEEPAALDPNAKPMLDQTMTVLADDILDYLSGAAEDGVILGTFAGAERTSAAGTAAGPRVIQALTTALTAKKVKIVESNAFRVDGTYQAIEDEGTGKFVVQMQVIMTDRQGKELHKFAKYFCTSEQEAAAFMGVTADLPLNPAVKGLEEERAEVLETKALEPTVTVVDTLIRPSPESLFGLELCVLRGDKYVPLPVSVIDGLAHVDIQDNDLYAVRVVNNSELPLVGVSLTIDGINMLAFSRNKDYARLGKVVVPKGGALIKGWHITDEQSRMFHVKAFGPDLPAARFGTAPVGVITATFCAAFKPNESPAGEPVADLAERGGTGFGPAVSQKYVPMRLEFGAIRSTISVRYSRN